MKHRLTGLLLAALLLLSLFPAAAASDFSDVPEAAYYAEAVHWAVEAGVTTGTGPDTFSPEEICTRAQVVTFLWRAAGSPGAPSSGDNELPVAAEEPGVFADVSADAYYAAAVGWAVERRITTGTDEKHFSPEAPCTRAQVVTFLWRAAENPAVENASPRNAFLDVPKGAYYTAAVRWAVSAGVTQGTGNTSFSPDAPCTRAQVVTFLHRAAEPVSQDGALDRRVAVTLARMTTEEKVAQLFCVTPEALTGIGGYATVAGETTRKAFDRYPVGGILYFAGNLKTPEQTRSLLHGMQRISADRIDLPVLLAVDEEGGTVARISGRQAFGISAYPNACNVKTAAEAERIGTEMGGYLSELGFNLDLAPVADVLVDPASSMKYRSFGSDPAQVASLCAAFSDGLWKSGVWSCRKHFPGYGGAAADPHYATAVSYRTREQLLSCELVPFRDAAERGAPCIMVAHVTLPNVTQKDVPATLSRELITELLRGELGYDGVVITDAMNMGAIVKNYGLEEASLLALEAGADVLLLTSGFRATYDAVLAAVRSGRISEARLNESVTRILRLKLGG